MMPSQKQYGSVESTGDPNPPNALKTLTRHMRIPPTMPSQKREGSTEFIDDAGEAAEAGPADMLISLLCGDAIPPCSKDGCPLVCHLPPPTTLPTVECSSCSSSRWSLFRVKVLEIEGFRVWESLSTFRLACKT